MQFKFLYDLSQQFDIQLKAHVKLKLFWLQTVKQAVNSWVKKHNLKPETQDKSIIIVELLA